MADEREKLEETIRQLEQLKASGAMSAALADASIAALKEKLAAYANLEGDGAIAQERDSLTVGAGGIGIKGNVIINALPPGASPAELRAAYLNHLFESVSQLRLAGIDPKMASDADAQINLGAIRPS